MSIDEFIADSMKRGLSEADMEFEAKRKFPKNTIGRAGGLKHFRELYRQLGNSIEPADLEKIEQAPDEYFRKLEFKPLCNHTLKKDTVLGGHYCTKCKTNFKHIQ